METSRARSGASRPRLLGVVIASILGAGVHACAAGSTTDGALDGGLDATTPDATEDVAADATKKKPDSARNRPDVSSTDAPTTDAAGDAGVPIGGVCNGSNCAPPGECATIGSAQYCTEPCPAAGCPGNTYCSNIGGTEVCVPNLGQECLACTSPSDCKLPSDACLMAAGGAGFCATDCSVTGTCPTGYSCETMAEYTAGTGGGDAGGDASGGGAVDGGDAGDVPRWCAPPGGGGCCSAANAGMTETCTVTNANGTCTAQAVCNGETGTWVGCVTPTGALTSGCSCPSSGATPGATCATATSIGSVSDASGSPPIVVSGRLASPTAVAVYTFSTTDTVNVMAGPSDSYHVNVAFTLPAMSSEFVMDVIRGAPCSDTPAGSATSITSYDWCVNGTNGTLGGHPCGPTATNHCTDESSVYYVRVHRAAGATAATCAEYQLTITAAGGTCDFTQQCAPPPDAG